MYFIVGQFESVSVSHVNCTGSDGVVHIPRGVEGCDYIDMSINGSCPEGYALNITDAAEAVAGAKVVHTVGLGTVSVRSYGAVLSAM